MSKFSRTSFAGSCPMFCTNGVFVPALAVGAAGDVPLHLHMQDVKTCGAVL